MNVKVVRAHKNTNPLFFNEDKEVIATLILSHQELPRNGDIIQLDNVGRSHSHTVQTVKWHYKGMALVSVEIIVP